MQTSAYSRRQGQEFCRSGPRGPENREVKACRWDSRNALEESRQHSGERLSNEALRWDPGAKGAPGGTASPQEAGVACIPSTRSDDTGPKRNESGVVKSVKTSGTLR
jgi:hypothetical protein